jgi:malate dehydrogenase (oxaloacetate-decarboxylating)
VANSHPTILIGTSTQPAAFSESIVTDMAAHVQRPIIMPLSNPTSRCEALPADLIRWTGGRALVATGSPFGPVRHNGRDYQIAQANNALIFPGLGLGVTLARARRISNGMLSAAAAAIAGLCDDTSPGAALLPAVKSLRAVSAAVAAAVALAAQAEGLAGTPLDHPVEQVHEAMWKPVYPKIELI